VMLQRLGEWTVMSVWYRIGALAVCVAASMLIYVGACLVVGLRPAQFRLHLSSSDV